MSASKGLVDFHCHLDLYPDHRAVVQEAEAAGVFTLAVTTTPRAWPRNHEFAQATHYVRAALGLHPQLVEKHANELALWDTYLKEALYIGEVGLDAGPRFYKSLDLQKKIFEHILRRCAEAGNKVISVHSVRTVKAVLDHIEAYLPPGQGTIVLHWFTGTKAEAKRAIEMGCYFSVNAAMFNNERHISMVSALPLERLLTETDGPFTQTGERPSKPSDVLVVVESIGRLHGISSVEVVANIKSNLRRVLTA
jgi:TatD DNase family protein